jgi:phospholipase/carboxylesterase
VNGSSEGLGFAHRFEAGEDPAGPTLLLLHGTGGDEHDLIPLGRALAPTANLLAPRGQVLERGVAPRWFRREAEGRFDVDDLVDRAGELADFVRAAATQHGFEPTRVIAAGFSNGANIAAALLLLGHDVLRGAVLFAPMIPLRPQVLPDASTVGVFISAGRRDPICPPEQAEELAALLSEAGAAVEVRWHDGGHHLATGHVALAREWCAKLLTATAADPGASPP